jgi:UDP-glucose 4-epimerase
MAHYLVTGRPGFIGLHLADVLYEKGHQVTILDNLSTGKKDNLLDSLPTHFQIQAKPFTIKK